MERRENDDKWIEVIRKFATTSPLFERNRAALYPAALGQHVSSTLF